MKPPSILCASFVALAVFALAPKFALAQTIPPHPTYAVCVGQYQYHCPKTCNVKGGPHMACTGYDAFFGCDPYASNPLKLVKTFCNGKFGGTSPPPVITWRTQIVSRDKCGYSVIGIACN